jgi:hypothetical protein
LAEIAEAAVNLPSGESRETIERHVYEALWDQLKLVAFSTGYEITAEKLDSWRQQLAVEGLAAYPVIAHKIGLSLRNPHVERNESLRTGIAEAEVCIGLSRGDGRTRLHTALTQAAS